MPSTNRPPAYLTENYESPYCDEEGREPPRYHCWLHDWAYVGWWSKRQSGVERFLNP
jgi:hypothetical protein